jgi:hypothetical protein
MLLRHFNTRRLQTTARRGGGRRGGGRRGGRGGGKEEVKERLQKWYVSSMVYVLNGRYLYEGTTLFGQIAQFVSCMY